MTGSPHVSSSSIRELLTALAAPDAPPDAVTAAAVAAGMGTSLLLLVASLPQTRSDSVEDRLALVRAAAALSGVQEQLLETTDTEAAVKIFAARNMPQARERERTQRDAAIQLALRAAAEVPLEVMRLSVLGLKHACTVTAHSCRAASGDMELAIALLRAGVAGARANLEIKLTSLTDVLYTETVVEEIVRLSEEATSAARQAESLVHPPPA
jgi:formiminotetrahydrofolate cyclodeaminase